jgi:hypothetical protein
MIASLELFEKILPEAAQLDCVGRSGKDRRAKKLYF